MYFTDFWFLTLHCTDLCKSSWEIFKNDEFIKNMKIAHFIGFFWPYMVGHDKQKLFYDNQHGKIKKIHISDFWFLELHHWEFSKTCWEIFKNLEIMQYIKDAHFLGHFSNRIIWIWLMKNISWWSAWKNEENVHLRLFCFWNFIAENFAN